MRTHLAPAALLGLLSAILPGCAVDDTEPPGAGTTTTVTTTTTTSTSTTVPAPPYEPPTVEAGFLEVPAQPGAAAHEARLFYSFHPAEEAPEKAPLLVFFNGGPGSATSAGLLAFGTGPFTLSTTMKPGDAPVENPHRMSRFAHLLYLDARHTGFSYGLSAPGEPCVGDSNVGVDAADFVFALLGFLDARPALRGARVVLVGESYGGARAPAMLHLLQRYGEAAPPGSPLDPKAIPGLVDRIQAHLDATSPERAGHVFTPDEVAEQFGWQVLIQPNIAGRMQFDFEAPWIADDPIIAGYQEAAEPASHYDVRISEEEQLRIDHLAASSVTSPEGFAALAGLPPHEVPLLGPADREGAFRFEPSPPQAPDVSAGLEATLGQLGEGDYYWASFVRACGYWLGDAWTLNAFFSGLPRTHTFITRARYDAVVYSPALPALLAESSAEVTLDDAPRPGVERPGWIHVAYPSGQEPVIRFPPYESGHAVAITQAQAFSADVEVWLREVGAVRD